MVGSRARTFVCLGNAASFQLVPMGLVSRILEKLAVDITNIVPSSLKPLVLTELFVQKHLSYLLPIPCIPLNKHAVQSTYAIQTGFSNANKFVRKESVVSRLKLTIATLNFQLGVMIFVLVPISMHCLLPTSSGKLVKRTFIYVNYYVIRGHAAFTMNQMAAIPNKPHGVMNSVPAKNSNMTIWTNFIDFVFSFFHNHETKARSGPTFIVMYAYIPVQNVQNLDIIQTY